MPLFFFFFFFNDTATTEIYTLSLHDALPICSRIRNWQPRPALRTAIWPECASTMPRAMEDRKSTRLNSSHSQISYAVFCLKKKKHKDTIFITTHIDLTPLDETQSITLSCSYA